MFERMAYMVVGTFFDGEHTMGVIHDSEESAEKSAEMLRKADPTDRNRNFRVILVRITELSDDYLSHDVLV